MRRDYLWSLMISAALAGAVAHTPAAAQQRDLPAAPADRVLPDVASIEQRLRDRGLPEDRIAALLARVRAAIASGNHPHLERRLYNALHPGGADRPVGKTARESRIDVARTAAAARTAPVLSRAP